MLVPQRPPALPLQGRHDEDFLKGAPLGQHEVLVLFVLLSGLGVDFGQVLNLFLEWLLPLLVQVLVAGSPFSILPLHIKNLILRPRAGSTNEIEMLKKKSNERNPVY